MTQPIRWGILGCGDIAVKRVAAGIQSDGRSELTAACRRDPTALADFGSQFGVSQLYDSADDLIADPDVDAIYVSTPVYLHGPHTMAAAAAGKHVLVEKPMAMSAGECQRMIDACAKNAITLGVAYYRRFYPVIQRIGALLESGDLGRPLSISATTGLETRFPPDDWRVVKSQGGGGPLMDIGSHRLDLFAMLFGLPKKVHATFVTSLDYEVERSASLLLEFENQVHGVLQCHFGAADVADRLEVIGTNGRVVTESLNDGEITIADASGTRTESHPPHANFHAPLIADFTRAIELGQTPKISGQDGLVTTKIIDAAYRAK